MANKQSENFTTPVARMVMGSLYVPQTTDSKGDPLVYKTGVNKGKPRSEYFFRIAIPKGGESHWNQTEWGSKIWNIAHAAWPNGQTQAPAFAWKVIDGDSNVPAGLNSTPPSSYEGYPGNWVLTFTGGIRPQIVNHDGSKALLEDDAVYTGCYVQVAGNVAGNGSPQTPGVYLNHQAVAFSAHGERIDFNTIDPKTVGFGQGVTLPQGASKHPIASQGFTTPHSVSPPTSSATLATPPPHHGILTPPAPTKTMTPKAGGHSYEAYVLQNWTDAQLIAEGLMIP
jgi:hypothetical protein